MTSRWWYKSQTSAAFASRNNRLETNAYWSKKGTNIMTDSFKMKRLSWLAGATLWMMTVGWSGLLSSAEPEAKKISPDTSSPADPLAPWRAGVKLSVVSPENHHSIHSYYFVSPESPDGRWVLFYVSTTANSYEGEIRIRERATGKEIVLAREVAVEDAHRAACQQWISGGRSVVFHKVLPSGEWVVLAVDVASGKERLLAKGRQLGFGQAAHDLVPLYGPHWNPGDHHDLELLNVQTGEIKKTTLTAGAVKQTYPDWVAKQFGDKPISIFCPVLSPNLKRVFCKIATPGGASPGKKGGSPDAAAFRSKAASSRYGLLVYDLTESRFLFMREKWGHPGWHPDSRHILEVAGLVIDIESGKPRYIPEGRGFPGEHPAYSPDGSLLTRDTVAGAEPFNAAKGFWATLVVDGRTGKYVTLHQFNNAKGAQSWRVSHPHPVFSPDGKRIYFNVNDEKWTRLYVAEPVR